MSAARSRSATTLAHERARLAAIEARDEVFLVKARVAIARGKSSGWLRPRSARTAATAARFKVGASLALPVVDDGAPWDGSRRNGRFCGLRPGHAMG